ncbi:MULTISPECIES: oxidoreductase [Bacillaceae]|uniref:oxidoreductase n=1 Tax=Bacillaceae TaxID=186817 RepID=UPI000BFD4493|nr:MULTISPECIES: oxidoreductase [Bacillaceae]PGT90589.1 short-chain dehydrogenase [Bacillus sp. AFS040349]UGB30911.1 oxidoreductase [Metabacillus sp. B2-18]
MIKKIAVVTGASSGFGMLTALELAKNGYEVIATMRDQKRNTTLLSEANSSGIADNITIHELDVTSAESVSLFKELVGRVGQVDVLVNNAGFAGAGFVEEIPIDEYRSQFETNVFGAIAVTQAVLPIMRKKSKGKIINVSSISGRVGFPGLSPYVSSKYALEGWSESLRLEVKSFGIDVILVEPGSFQTNIWTRGKKVTENSLKKESPYYEMMRKLEDHIESGSSKFENPKNVARLITAIALKNKPTMRYAIGRGVKMTLLFKMLVPWTIFEKIVLSKLR